MKSYKNLLVQYQGGGYDGCVWEWNFFLFDRDGDFHNLTSSGRKGIEIEADARELIENEYIEGGKSIYIYDLTKQESLTEFAKETHHYLIATVGNTINKIYDDSIIYFFCSHCEEKSNFQDFYDSIAYNFDDGDYKCESLICDDCMSYRCDKCETVVNIYKEEMHQLDESYYVCQDCFDDSCTEILEGDRPCIMHIPYDGNQLEMFKEHSNVYKQKSKFINDDNEQEIKDYLKSKGFDIK